MPSKLYSNPKKQIPFIAKPFLNISSQDQLFQAISSLHLFSRQGIRLPTKTLAYLLQQCANFKSLKLGKWVHLHLKVTGLKKPNTLIANNLIHVYSECGDIGNAYKVFDKMSLRNLYSWNNMLSGYAKLGKIKNARKLFDKMPERDVVSWNTMIIGYAQSGFSDEALRFYKEFRELGIGYNEYTFSGLVNICVKVRDLEFTRQAHGQVLVAGFLSNAVVSCSILDSYIKCSQMGDARRFFDGMIVRDVHAWTVMVSGYALQANIKAAKELFDLMPKKNSISWTSLIAGYAKCGLGHEALELFREMMSLNVRPDQFTFSTVLSACASIASLNHGKQIHGYLIVTNFRPNPIVVSSLIHMYSTCGCLEVGRLVFDLMDDKQDVVLWNTMISALAHHGHGEEAIQIFDHIVELGMKPNRITMVAILYACSHSGLVQEGIRLFENMTSCHGIDPDQEHYACLIDLLGRAGQFDMLMNQLEKMSCEPNDQIWNALVGVCRIHENVELGRKIAEKLIELDPQSSKYYVLLSSMHAAAGEWELAEKVRQLMNEKHLRKKQAVSWINGD